MTTVRILINNENIIPDSLIEVKGNNFDYLIKVMRLKINDNILIFNGCDGEFLAKIININKKSCLIRIIQKTQDQEEVPSIILAFAPVKNVRIDFIAAKATEIGVGKFQPIITNHSIVDKINEKRFRANIKEACEQCERTFVPELLPIIKLDKYLNNIENNKNLILCDESIRNNSANQILSQIKFTKNKENIIFIGPEGGFSKKEFEIFYKIQNLHKISLGNNILRADTAIISALTLINQFVNQEKL